MFSFREITLSFFMFALRLNESTLKGKNLLLEEQILSFKSRFVFFFFLVFLFNSRSAFEEHIVQGNPL